MLILIVIILCIVAGVSFYKHHNLLGSITIVLLIMAQALLVMDSQYHYATKVNDDIHISQVKPITSIHDNHVMVTKGIKEGKTTYQAFVTKNKTNSKNHIILNKDKKVLVNREKNHQNQLVTNNHQYQYTNQFANLLFAGITNQNQLKQQVVTYNLGNDWYLLSKGQLKSVAKKLKSKSFQNKLTNTVKISVQKKIKRNPKLLKQPQKLKIIQNQLIKSKIGSLLKDSEASN
ncbi:DUF4811 domain-containing protein [Lentilactobacillus hilgardii]|uniref:DUF4811 domain-containing protein n=1 Tax=Lentilactobacillus hilgardii TaxID=1588 RepID=A0A6P1E8Q6_LENHI|nr:DUF4811 domain-containing protein [Lentilactobacillus hilgardii]EEI70965.1 hypothetical protein HMPREF0496_1699 [Lentilactobacillus hilgardii ATCC 27305]QHB52999.1 DUF4811 domain-containing protein [Lentilactobacillus hilgardii]RRG12448.1 MAG: DUF4811 domain-containing protein [Lactobacillus sp.]